MSEPQPLPLDKLAKIYVRIRTAKQTLTKDYEASLDALKNEQQAVANAIKTQMQATGAKSVKTDGGTIIMGMSTRYWTNDWDNFKTFCKENDSLDLFEKRIAQGNMEKFLQENPDKAPPGLNTDREVTITVRKPT